MEPMRRPGRLDPLSFRPHHPPRSRRSLQPPVVRVHKFGGTSVETTDRIRHAAGLVAADRGRHPEARIVVVTSALGGVTDDLLRAIALAASRSGPHRQILDDLRQRHHAVAAEVAPPDQQQGLRAVLEGVLAETEELLQGIYLLRECTPRFSDAVVSAGERLAAPLFASALRAAGCRALHLDARDLIVTDDTFTEAAVDPDRTRERIQAALVELSPDSIPVITGFIAATPEGVTTTLGRSGSDYTATLLGSALEAEVVIIWTDVDGVLSADPRLVPEAQTIEQLTFQEAAELAHFGAKVLHPRTMRPLEGGRTRLWIKNAARPDVPGTLISERVRAEGPPIRGLTAAREVALITLHGAGLVDVPRLSARTFEALAGAGVQVLLISQASSEGSLCFAVRARDVAVGEAALRAAFARELQRGDLRGLRVERELAVIAAVGHAIRQRPGLAGKMFATLARAHVNVQAIAEGASDHNLTCVVADEDTRRSVDALHEAFALNRLRAHLVVVGVGQIGSRLLELLGRQASALLADRVHLRLLGVANSSRLLWQEGGLPFAGAADRLSTEGETIEDATAALTDRLRRARLERLIVVDATPSEELPRTYAAWLAAGAAIITPNQRALTGPLERLGQIRAAAADAEVPFLYETAVGSGLSVISTLRDLVRTGDAVHRIEGVFSGTLAFVFDALRTGSPFSRAVREATARGLTESDPRVDLTGEDVARKLLVLAREMGRPAERAQVEVQALIPDWLREVPRETFWERLGELDDFWARTRESVRQQGRQLQYVAELADGRLKAGVQALAPDSPMASLSGSSVLFAFHTNRYKAEPLVVRGPSASADITAAVLLADIVRAAHLMR